MKRLIAATVLLCVLPCVASAAAFSMFIRDDFQLTFGVPGQPGSAGGQIGAWGDLLNPAGDVIADFGIQGGNPLGAYQQGSEYWTDYVIDSIIIGLYDRINNVWTATYWTGTGELMTRVKVGGGLYPEGAYAYPSAPYYHPLHQPDEYMGMGRGEVAGSGSGDWEAFSVFYIPWIGTYDWSYEAAPIPGYQRGNMQGMMTDIPEPSTLILLGLGLTAAGVSVIRRRRKA